MNYKTYRLTYQVAVWLSGNTLVLPDEVTLHWAWLVLGWVAICGQINHLYM